MTNQSQVDNLIHEIGQLVLADEETRTVEWNSISVVFEIDDHSNGLEGWRYCGRDFAPFAPLKFDAMYRAEDLRTAMRDVNGRAWQACLMQLVRPGPTITLDFAYDDNPWRLKAVSLDLSDHAMALRSKDHPLGESCPPSEPAVSK